MSKDDRNGEKQQFTFHTWNPLTEEQWELSLKGTFRTYRWTSDTSKLAIVLEGVLRIHEFGKDQPLCEIDLLNADFRRLAWSGDNGRLAVLTKDKVLCFDAQSDEALWEIRRPSGTRDSLWLTDDGLLCRTDGQAIYHHDFDNGGPLSLKTVTLETPIGTPTPIADNSLLVDNRRVVDAQTGELQWSS